MKVCIIIRKWEAEGVEDFIQDSTSPPGIMRKQNVQMSCPKACQTQVRQGGMCHPGDTMGLWEESQAGFSIRSRSICGPGTLLVNSHECTRDYSFLMFTLSISPWSVDLEEA